MSPRDPNQDPRRHDRLMVYGAVAASLTLIAGLWLMLLPGQLNLSQRDSQAAPLWQRLRDDGQTAISQWQQSFGETGQVGQALQAAKQDLAATASSPTDAQAEEISRFGDRLNAETIETSNSQQHVPEEATE